VVAALAAVVATLALLAACGGSTAEPTATATPSATALLERASRQLADTPTVHFELTVDGATYIDPAKTIRLLSASGDLERPDRVSTTFKVEVGGRTVTLQLITIGKKSWTTNVLTGDWGPAPFEFAYRPTVLFDNQSGIGPVMGRVSDAERLPDDTVDGRTAYHVRARVDEKVIGPLTYYTIKGSPVTVDLWIDQETNDLLRAVLAESPAPDRPHPATWTLDLSHHGDKVTIEPPV
ncbi:MAG TPA: LppX_LprAFG lipoprotein, partial [Thermomicrobiales bacterium]|nr:LppX_LprAFG lipoprotein [Thermomicrobiales bacterium]